VIRPNLNETKLVANSINADKQRGNNETQYWIVYVPQKVFNLIYFSKIRFIFDLVLKFNSIFSSKFVKNVSKGKAFLIT
jgi:hypothetical protein